jgi:hypothetical protein
VAARESKSTSELRIRIMREVRKHPDWINVLTVAITRPRQSGPDQPNWDAAFTMNGNAPAPREAFEIVRRMQAIFSLAD